MRKSISKLLVLVLCCMVFQPFAYAQGEVQSGKTVDLSDTAYVLVDEQYAASDNSAYQANQETLEGLGWSAYEQQEKGGNDWQSTDLGTFDAQTGQLLMKKTGDINTPAEAPSAGLVYSVDKIFTARKDNWKGDSRVSVWTQHFKGDYEIELKGSFHQTKGQVYYDIQGYRNNGTPDRVARYKINPGTNGYINVYNNRLNGGGVTDYPVIQNPSENRTIRTRLSSETATYQTFVNDSETACFTTVENASPNDTFNMTGWNMNTPGVYMTGIRITAQKQTPQDDVIAAIDAIKLIELDVMRDDVDEAIDRLSMTTLTETPDRVTANLKSLPYTLAGVDISWTSSRPELISNNGTLVGLPSVDTDVVMTAKLTNPINQFTKYMEFRVTVAKVKGFKESYPWNIEGVPSSAGAEGTKTFAELPKWNFSYPGIGNGTNGEVHEGQVLIKNGYLTFKKISDRQTDNYNECVVGMRTLSNDTEVPAMKDINIEFTAVTEGTGTMRFALLTAEGAAACTVILDSSVNAVDVSYGDQNSDGVRQVTQRIGNVNPKTEHQYTIEIKSNGTFTVKIDGKVIRTEAGRVSRSFLPGTDETSILSHMKVWITNITKQNTEIGKLKSFSVMEADGANTIRKEVMQEEILQVVVSGKSLQNILTKTFAVVYSADDLELIDAYAPTPLQDLSVGTVAGSNMNITEILPGSLKFKITPSMGTYNYWGGVATILKFRAKRSAITVITLE